VGVCLVITRLTIIQPFTTEPWFW